MGRPKKNKVQTDNNKTVVNNVLEEMKNVSLMTNEEVSEMKVEGRAVPPKKEEKVDIVDNVEEEKIIEDNIDENNINEEDEQETVNEELPIDTDKILQDLEKEETQEVKKEEPKVRRRTTREMYGYDWCGLCYDE